MSKTAYCDGACRVSNPGQTSCAFAVFEGDTLLYFSSRYLGPTLYSNNVSEYQGLLDLLKWAAENQEKNLKIYCDSLLVCNQVNDVWDVNSLDLKPLWLQAYTMRVRGEHTLEHVKGHSGNPGNELVDNLCNLELDRVLN